MLLWLLIDALCLDEDDWADPCLSDGPTVACQRHMIARSRTAGTSWLPFDLARPFLAQPAHHAASAGVTGAALRTRCNARALLSTIASRFSSIL
jgi:hypothetical protein